MKLYMFRTVHLSIIRSLFTVHSAMVYVIQVSRQLSSRFLNLLESWFYYKEITLKCVWLVPACSILPHRIGVHSNNVLQKYYYVIRNV